MSEDRDESGRFASAPEPAFGEASLEREAGYTPLPDPGKPAEQDGLTVKEAAEQLVEMRAQEMPDTTIRTYINGGTAEEFDEATRTQPLETVTAERAARDLAEMRQAEAKEAEDKEDADLAEQYDKANPPPQLKIEAKEPEPPKDLDTQLKEAFEIPQLREAIEGRVAAVEEERQHYSRAADTAVQMAEVVMLTQFPELAVADEQRGAVIEQMKQTSPERYQQLLNLGAQAQQATEMQTQAKEQAAKATRDQFDKFAKAHDGVFEERMAKEAPETRDAVRKALMSHFAEHGITPELFGQLYRSEPMVRHSAMQHLMYKAGRHDAIEAEFKSYRDKIESAKNAVVARPLPPVHRPGVSRGARETNAASLSSLDSRLSQSGSIKDAAALLTARRASRRD